MLGLLVGRRHLLFKTAVLDVIAFRQKAQTAPERIMWRLLEKSCSRLVNKSFSVALRSSSLMASWAALPLEMVYW